MGAGYYMIIKRDKNASVIEQKIVYGYDSLHDKKEALFHLQEQQKNLLGSDTRVLYCLCNCIDISHPNNMIPLTISKPNAGDSSIRLVNSKRSNAAQHSILCRHNNTSLRKNVPLFYSEKLRKDCCNIILPKIAGKSIKQQAPSVVYTYVNNFGEKHDVNNCLSFLDFVLMENMAYFAQYWQIHKRRRLCLNMQDFNKSLYGKIANLAINPSSDGSSATTLSELGYHFIYTPLVNIAETKKDSRFISILYRKNDNTVQNLSIFSKLIESACKEFKAKYHGLSIEQALSNKECNVIFTCLYHHETNKRYPYYQDIHFILVDNFGLCCDSINQAVMYNRVTNFLKAHAKEDSYMLYKPYLPSLLYSGHPEYISDGIILNRYSGKEIVLESFEGSWVECKDIEQNKMQLIRKPHFFRNLFNEASFPEQRFENFLSISIK